MFSTSHEPFMDVVLRDSSVAHWSTGHWTIMDVVLRDASVAHWTLDYYGRCVERFECCPLDIGLLWTLC